MDERVSDADREQAMAWLQDHLVAGRLTLEEFSERVDQAYVAIGQADIERVRSGLPATEHLPVPRSQRRATRFTGALLAHVVERGRLRRPLDSRRRRFLRRRPGPSIGSASCRPSLPRTREVRLAPAARACRVLAR